MRKLSVIIFALLLASSASAVILVGFGVSPVVDDSYSESNYVAGIEWTLNSTGATEIGQSFTSGGGVLDNAIFYLYKSGTPTGNATAKVYAHTGTYGTSSLPTGSVLATSDVFDVATLTTTVGLKTFSFSGANRITLSSGYYVITVAYSGGDYSNKVWVGADNTTPAHGGNMVYYYAGWGSYSTHDAVFYVYVVR